MGYSHIYPHGVNDRQFYHRRYILLQRFAAPVRGSTQYHKTEISSALAMQGAKVIKYNHPLHCLAI